MLENLPLPVILVGAQRSSDRGSSDAYLNLISAVRFIAETDFSGVAICMHENKNDENCLISPACKTRKLHSSTRDAFKPVNAKPVARIGEKIEFLSEYLKKDKNRKLNLKTRLEERVGILKIHPNMQPEEISCFKNYKGLVIEGTGLGHAPVSNGNEEVFEALKKLSKTCVIVMTSQTIFGRVNMNVYSTGRKLQEIGIISGKDMLTETAFIKLAWLLGNYSQKETRKLVTKNLRGEISK